ncbi:NADP-dependent oxidoreductase [Microcella daejeonensis]|uniref:NADP-dependent oxidoreductase n=1 Tax=Microcella daejeonensis TaxID=2994971 RepID=A0A9E8S8S1_9MICO|nr:NADP-dependent oxidoreductase [Microcella daejeonensis]WAB81563.1 NADP-dependent oxidoreductase [Microcella daejeonensis]
MSAAAVAPERAAAIVYEAFGGPEVLQVVEREVGRPAPEQVRVRLRAAGLNPVDYKIRRGASRYSFPLPITAGREFAGVIDAVGEAVEDFAIGDRVFGSIPQGAFSELVLVCADVIARVPDGVPLPVAGGLALAGQTAWDALDSQHLRSGDSILVSAAAGGVGGILCQLAVARGIEVIGTAGEGNHDWLRSIGVEPVLYGEGLLERLRALREHPVTAVFDLHGPDTIRAALEWGVPAERINTNATDPTPFGIRAVGRGAVRPSTLDALAGLVADGILRIPIAAEFPLAEARAAFERLETGHVRGKVVLTAGR